MKKTYSVFLFMFWCMVCFSQTEKTNSDSCYAIKEKDTTWKNKCVQIQPSFSGGDGGLFSFLGANIKYPQIAKDLGLQGKVFLSFVVDLTGEVIDVVAYKGITIPDKINGKKLKRKTQKKYEDAAKAMNNEALRVVKMMPKWSPGMQDSKPVKVKYILPISYKLKQ